MDREARKSCGDNNNNNKRQLVLEHSWIEKHIENGLLSQRLTFGARPHHRLFNLFALEHRFTAFVSSEEGSLVGEIKC